MGKKRCSGLMMPIPTFPPLGIPKSNEQLEELGFKLKEGGAHSSRTIMLKEITSLISRSSSSASLEEYRAAVVQNNALGKVTVTTREKSFRYLRELYFLSDQSSLFTVFRQLASYDSLSVPLLAVQVAWARDPLLRATTRAVYSGEFGSTVTKESLVEAIQHKYHSQYSSLNCDKIARNTGSSWTQSGHLSGRTKKIRTRVEARPASASLALYLGHLCGWSGEQLFTTPWCQLLDLNSEQARSLASHANREGLIGLRSLASVVEISFPLFDQPTRATS